MYTFRYIIRQPEPCSKDSTACAFFLLPRVTAYSKSAADGECSLMEKTYVIGWKSKSRGTAGRGKSLFARAEAEQVAQELNQNHPGFIHEPLDVGGSSVTGATEPESYEPAAIELFASCPTTDEVLV